MSKRSRHHHYVPKALQRHFSENAKNLWYSSVDRNGTYLDPELRNVDSTFKEFDFYTILNADNMPTDKIEKIFYGAIDDYLGKLLLEVHDAFDNGVVPTFDGEQLVSLHHLVLNLASRTPHSGNGKLFDDVEIGRDFAMTMVSVYEAQDPTHPGLERFRLALNDQRELCLHGRNIRVKGQALRKNDAIDALKDFEVRWAVSDGRPSFVLQSAVVHRIGNGGPNGLSNPQCEWWIPISPKRAIVLVRDPTGRLPLVCKVSRDHMREINESAARDRRTLASQSRELLLSLTRGKHRRQN